MCDLFGGKLSVESFSPKPPFKDFYYGFFVDKYKILGNFRDNSTRENEKIVLLDTNKLSAAPKGRDAFSIVLLPYILP